MDIKTKEKYFLAGIDVNCPYELNLNFNKTLDWVTTLNAELILKSLDDEYLKKIINSGLVTIDGFWTKYAFEKKYAHLCGVNKMSGSTLIYSVTKEAIENNKKVLLLGASATENERAVENLNLMYKTKNVYGFSPEFSSYPFTESFLTSIEAVCKDIKPNLIITAFGVPKQEYWAYENQDLLRGLGVNYIMFFGGAIDIVSGKFKRAPKLVQSLGLESMYRLIQDPSRYKREFNKLRFFFKILKNTL